MPRPGRNQTDQRTTSGIVARSELHHPRRFFLGRHPSVGRELINQLRQMLTKPGKQIVTVHAGLLTQGVQRLAPERFLQIVRRNLLVRAIADPGLRDMAVSALLESFDQVVEAAAQHGSGRGAAEQAAQSATELVVQIAATRCSAGGDATPRAPPEAAADVAAAPARTGAGRERLVGAARREWSLRSAGRDSLTAASLERLVRKETQQRHHQRRHAAALAAARLRLRLTARAIEHAVKNIRQSHDYLL